MITVAAAGPFFRIPSVRMKCYQQHLPYPVFPVFVLGRRSSHCTLILEAVWVHDVSVSSDLTRLLGLC